MKNVKYKQCTLTKSTPTGILNQVAWIPTKFAKINTYVKIKEDEVWEDGWHVDQASETELDEKHLPDYRKQIRGHRKVTGDSLRK